MTRSIVLAACATMLAAGPATARAASGPDYGNRSSECRVQEPGPEQESKGAWRDRLSDWLRRHSQRDGIGHRGYYLRSPLLHAFGPELPEDCESANAQAGRVVAPAAQPAPAAEPLPRASKPCTDDVDDAARQSREQARLRAGDREILAIAVHAALARGESVVFYDLEGNLLRPDGAQVQASAHDRCG